jgi:hypothetical protein
LKVKNVECQRWELKERKTYQIENLMLIEAVQRFGSENWGLIAAALQNVAKSWRKRDIILPEPQSRFTESEIITENVCMETFY